MRDFDELGSKLCKAQGSLFEESITRFDGSSSIFIKRYMNSEVCFNIDKYNEFDIARIIDEIETKYDLSRGNVKYDAPSMYWIGYIYRYWAYTYEIHSSEIFKIISGSELFKLYEPYHSLDPSVAIKRIYESKEIKTNQDLLEIMKRIYMI